MTGNFQVSSKLPDGRIFVVASETYAGFCEALESAVGIEESQDLLKDYGTITRRSTYQWCSGSTEYPRSTWSGNHPYRTSSDGWLGNTGAPTSRSCSHGLMSKRTGAGAKGPWKAFMCPSPKGTPDQCEPVWVRRNDPEWASF
jgi:hypothetical protein